MRRAVHTPSQTELAVKIVSVFDKAKRDQLLRELRKPFVDVSFNESTHELVNVLDRVYALARLSGGLELAEHTKLNLASVRAKVLNQTCRAPPRLASHSCLERTRGAGVQSPRVKTRTRL